MIDDDHPGIRNERCCWCTALDGRTSKWLLADVVDNGRLRTDIYLTDLISIAKRDKRTDGCNLGYCQHWTLSGIAEYCTQHVSSGFCIPTGLRSWISSGSTTLPKSTLIYGFWFGQALGDSRKRGHIPAFLVSFTEQSAGRLTA